MGWVEDPLPSRCWLDFFLGCAMFRLRKLSFTTAPGRIEREKVWRGLSLSLSPVGGEEII